jgi:prepilin-type N-terminal cleavage/methylation domain-containing protein
MRRRRGTPPQQGFTLVELLVALGIFLVVTGAAFTLLGTSQKRYQTESQVLSSFQEARLGLDQIVRDVNDAGFPPPTFSDGVASHAYQYAISPFAWSSGAGYPGASCQIGIAGGGNCTTATANDTAPGDFDLIVETNPNPQDSGSQVQWIRYQLQGTILMRSVVGKAPGDDPDADTTAAGKLVPFVQNVVNNVCPSQLPTCQTAYPGLFPGGTPVPIFAYFCDNPNSPPPTIACPIAAAGVNSPANIRDVTITLIVAAPLPDTSTGQPRLVMLNGRGRRVNPNQ